MHVLYLAGYLRRHVSGADVHVVDGYALSVREAAQKIVEHRPDILFIHGDTPTATGMYEVVERVKETTPHRFLAVIFGEHPSALPMEPFERCGCDVVMAGDPEPTAGAVCAAFMSGVGMEAFAGVPSIVYRDADGRIVTTPRSTKSLELDDLPLPARDLVDLSAYRGTFYKKGTRETSVQAARGCPWSCTYCGPAWRWAMERPRFRHRSVKSLVDELELVHETYGTDDILLMIDTLNSNVKWAGELCREIIARGLKLNMKVHVRADFLTPELLGLMRKAGFWLVYMGIETANDRTLRGVRKQLTMAQVEGALTAIRDAGIKVVAELMNCLFWEEDGVLVHEGLSDALRTLRFARRMYAKGLIQAMYWSPMMPLPASDSYRIAVKHDLIVDEVKGKWHLWFPVQRPVVRLDGVGALKWYFIQWLGKVHQTYFLTASGLLHASRRRFVTKRLLQLGASTLGALWRASVPGAWRRRERRAA